MRCEERMRQQEIENAELRSELRSLVRSEDLARVEVSVFERVQSMVCLRPKPLNLQTQTPKPSNPNP